MIGMSLPQVIQNAAAVSVPSGASVFKQGQSADNFLVVASGCVKVFARSAEGKEVVLYRVREGEMCTLTTSCLLGQSKYPAEAVTETDVIARAIPAAQFDQLLNDSESFRRFVFASFGQRLSELMQRFEEMVLEGIHSRLAHFLLQHANDQGIAEITHEQLAQEIGTAREVVSRHLKSMEKAGMIGIQRGKVTIVDPAMLEALFPSGDQSH